jgi:sulfate transport system permease protein
MAGVTNSVASHTANHVASGVPSSSRHRDYQASPATREAPWVRYTLLTIALGFFTLFLLMPLFAVFTWNRMRYRRCA